VKLHYLVKSLYDFTHVQIMLGGLTIGLYRPPTEVANILHMPKIVKVG